MSQSAESFVEENFCAVFQKLSGSEELWIRERAIKIFRRKSFVPQARKLGQGNPFVLCFGKLLVANKLMDKRGRGGIKIFRRNFFVPQCRKLSQRNPFVLCFRKHPVAKKILHKRWGGIKIFRQKFFCLEVQKEFVGEHFCAVFQRNSSDEKHYG